MASVRRCTDGQLRLRASSTDQWFQELRTAPRRRASQDQALNGLSALLTTRDLRAMNRRVADVASVAEVASSWRANADDD